MADPTAQLSLFQSNIRCVEYFPPPGLWVALLNHTGSTPETVPQTDESETNLLQLFPTLSNATNTLRTKNSLYFLVSKQASSNVVFSLIFLFVSLFAPIFFLFFFSSSNCNHMQRNRARYNNNSKKKIVIVKSSQRNRNFPRTFLLSPPRRCCCSPTIRDDDDDDLLRDHSVLARMQPFSEPAGSGLPPSDEHERASREGPTSAAAAVLRERDTATHTR